MDKPFSITLAPPFLTATFAQPQRVLSWSMLRPGMVIANRIAWLEVRNADLPADADPFEVIGKRVSDAGLEDAVVLVTSRDIRRHHHHHAPVENVHANCLTTAGLSNSERVGTRLHMPPPFAGTINTLVHLSVPLTEGGMLEALSIATEARTTAILEAGLYRGGKHITGTGTDCIAIASPIGGPAQPYAGKHTAIGEAIGAAAYHATVAAIDDWKTDCAELNAAMRAS
ncbi:Adenosylcobinamide amidohydrolase [Hyphomicrobium sulfonivorans]|uniref:Adenosylcobinamide amidohydrolase n=1 Tax=Hyphomicrobium sulfonivorans TaxID=121290 RepID=A0A109BAM5_HYPSL|nr:adenosylcobinamide amidohydrolase [Hyphomicrobium sulfonivorans]KWT65243.1 Adenosylcobinamide amidohydrolase [Hyphomicrobium sulfonivorans]